MTTGKTISPKSKFITAGFQIQTQITSALSNQNSNSTETPEGVSPSAVTEISVLTIFSLVPSITIPMPVPTKAV